MLLMDYSRQPLSNVRLKGKGWSWDTAWSHQQSSANKPVHKCQNPVHILPEKLLCPKLRQLGSQLKSPKYLLFHISPDVWNIYIYICRLVYTLWMDYNSSFGSYKIWMNCNSGTAYNCNTCLLRFKTVIILKKNQSFQLGTDKVGDVLFVCNAKAKAPAPFVI